MAVHSQNIHAELTGWRTDRGLMLRQPIAASVAYTPALARHAVLASFSMPVETHAWPHPKHTGQRTTVVGSSPATTSGAAAVQHPLMSRARLLLRSSTEPWSCMYLYPARLISSVPRDPALSVPRDPAVSLPRNPAVSLPRDPAGFCACA